MAKHVIITQGLPASGKSTFAKAWVEEEPTKRIRVNRDDIRRQIGPYWVPSREAYVTSIERAMITHALFAGYDVIVDATNFNPSQLTTLIQYHKGTYEIKSFLDVSIEECIKRDSLREHKVGESVIRDMYNKHIAKKTGKKIEQIKEQISLDIPSSQIAKTFNVSESYVSQIKKKLKNE